MAPGGRRSDVKKAIGALVASLLAACGSERTPSLSRQVQPANGPGWITRGSGAFVSEKGKVFCGVGVASRIRDAALRTSTSESRARDEIARTLESYVEVLAEHLSPTAGDERALAAERARVHQALRTYSQTELSRAVIVDHWTDSDGTEYALAQLDMATFKNHLDRIQELNARLREAVRARADRSFDALGKAEAKHDAR